MIRRKDLKLGFSDMWGYNQYTFNQKQNYFTHLLSLRYNVIIDNDNPELLIFSCFGKDHLNYNCKKLFFCGENTREDPPRRVIRPSAEYCNAALSQFPDTDLNRYFPLWCLFINWFCHQMPYDLPSNPTFLTSIKSLSVINRSVSRLPKNFCVFLNNNPVEDRVELFKSLSTIGKVDSYGKLLNNTGHVLRGSEKEKIELLKEYRLTIAFENSYEPGYNTEKIIHPYSANSVAIYSGGLDRSIFNSKSLFYKDDYSSIGEMVEHIGMHEADHRLYEQKLKEPLFKEDRIPLQFRPLEVLKWIVDKCCLDD